MHKTIDNRPKREWTTPKAICYGSVKDLTQQTKNKTWGGGDDVLVNEQAILSDVS